MGIPARHLPPAWFSVFAACGGGEVTGLTLVPTFVPLSVLHEHFSQASPAPAPRLPKAKCSRCFRVAPTGIAFPSAGWRGGSFALSALSVAGAKALEVSVVPGEKRLKLFPPPEFSSKTPECLRILLSSLACKML